MSNNKSYYYVVKKGIIPGIFRTWSDCKEQIHEYPGAIYKKFDNMQDAIKFLHNPYKSDKKETNNEKNDEKNDEKKSYSKFPNAKNNESSKRPKTIYDYFETYEQNDETIKEVKNNIDSQDKIYIFCDGSAIHNKEYKSVRCGYGVFMIIPNNDNFDCVIIGEELISSGTNNLAELTAILHGLKYLKNEYYKNDTNNSDSKQARNVCFVSDSKYSINCILVWSKTWKKNNWQTMNKKPVENKELIQDILIILEEVKELGFDVDFKHINSHQTKPENNTDIPNDYLFWFGNEMADQLARIGEIKKKYETPKILEKSNKI